jgi:hypothetical protein
MHFPLYFLIGVTPLIKLRQSRHHDKNSAATPPAEAQY